MAAERESKAAIRELAGLLNTDRQQARMFLREVQGRCGPIPFRAIADEVHTSGIGDVEAIARRINAHRTSSDPSGRS